jgi:hypothetical protein
VEKETAFIRGDKHALPCRTRFVKPCGSCTLGLPEVPSHTTVPSGCASSTSGIAEPVFSPSGYPLVVMVEPGQDRDSHDLVSCMMKGKRRSAQFRDLLLNTLMGSCPVEIGHIPIEYAARAASREGSRGGQGILVARSLRSVRRSHWLVGRERGC